MCDYSLMNVPNRLAVEGEVLVTYKFPSEAIGLASPDQVRRARELLAQHSAGIWDRVRSWFAGSRQPAVCAVCIPPGARLRLFGVLDSHALRTGSSEEVVFTQISATVNQFRDAVQFENGKLALVQELGTGVGVQVLSMALAEPREAVLENVRH